MCRLETQKKVTISILNSEGVVVQKLNTINLFQGQPIRLDISAYPLGSYFVKVVMDNSACTRQVIKIK